MKGPLLGLRCALILPVLLTGTVAVNGQQKKMASAQFEVRLPADAQLEVSGQKSRLTGTTRRFQSPPLEAGKEYVYTVKATLQGKQVTKELVVRASSSGTVDFGPEFASTAKPEKAGRFSLHPLPAVRVRAGAERELTIRISREHSQEPVEILFEDVPKGVLLTATTIPGKQESASVGLGVESDAPVGTVNIKIKAVGKSRKEGVLTLIVDRPLSAGASFTLESPPPMTLRAGEEKTFTLLVKRDQFDDPIEITFEHVPKGLVITEATVPAKEEKVELAVSADKTAPPGTASIKIRGTSGPMTKETNFELTIQ